MYRVELSHNFETAHRLGTESSPPKCQSIHGHSWWVTVRLEGPRLDSDGILVEFGAFKKALRSWLDGEVDHALLLKKGDPVAAALRAVVPTMRIVELDENPTTEVIAAWIFHRCAEILHNELGVPPETAKVVNVHVQETRVNAASYSGA